MVFRSKTCGAMLVALLGVVGMSRNAMAQETFPAGPTFPNTAWDCSGWHTVVSGDSCWSIQQEYSITLAQFLSWNPSVSADCATNFWATYSYCVRVGAPGPTMPGIASNCNKWHTVVSGDGCWSIQQQYSITAQQFLVWNPAVSSECTTNFWPDYSYCVGISNTTPGSSSTSKTSSATSSTAITSSTGTSSSSRTTISPTTTTPYSTRYPVTSHNLTAPSSETAFPPQHTAAGQPENCNRWHWVASGETCKDIANIYGTWLTEAQLYQYNPTLGNDCGGLYVGWYICVGVQPTTSVRLEWYDSASVNASIPEPTVYIPPPATFVQNFTAQPQQTGIPEGCQNFYLAKNGDTCDGVLEVYNYITRDQFFQWNPALTENCNGLLPGYYYCVASFAPTALPMPPTQTAGATPTASGITGECRAWYMAVGVENCASIALSFGTFSESDFVSWNPSVRSDCSNIQPGLYYCVAITDTPTTRTEPVPTALPGGSSLPTQTGIVAGCTRYWIVSRTDTCDSIISAAGIAASDFHTWNPAVGADCSSLLPDYYVCVSTGPQEAPPTSTVTFGGDGTGTTSLTATTTAASSGSESGSETGTTTTPATPITSPTDPVTTPTPYMPGMVSGCVRFYFRGPEAADLFCYDLAAAAGVSLADFVTWNPQVKEDCSGLWALTWYCIGVSGPGTTISSGLPQPAAATA